jgi:aminotransferase
MSVSKSVPERVARHVRDVPRSGIRDFFDIVSTMRDVISLGVGEPDFDTPWHVREAAVFALERGATHYTSNFGLLKLRQAIARYVKSFFGPAYDPEREILITVGVSEAMDLAIRALVNPGDEVLYHEPCYVSYRPLVTFAHGRPVAVETRMENGFRLTRAMLEERASPRTRLLVLNFPNNPTGAALREEDVRDIAAFAVERDVLVLTDEIYAELTYGRRHVSLLSVPGMRERTVLLHGFSKAWAMTGFRIGYACGPPELIEAMMKIHQYTMLCAPVLSQEAAIEALAQPERDVAEMRAEYDRRRRFVAASFREMGLPCVLPEGAFYAFPRIADLGLSSKDFALRLLEEEKVAAVHGTAFGACGEGHLRCSYATAMDDLKEAMARLARFVERRRTR